MVYYLSIIVFYFFFGMQFVSIQVEEFVWFGGVFVCDIVESSCGDVVGFVFMYQVVVFEEVFFFGVVDGGLVFEDFFCFMFERVLVVVCENGKKLKEIYLEIFLNFIV